MADKKTEGMLGSFDTNGNYVDPYGVTFYDGFTGKNLNNADTEKSAYGDDSTLATYNTGNNKGGTNDKYTGENTRNTYTGYNADIKTADLNPDYQYGGLAQQQESIDNSYIANRNDNIASALYNEGRRSIEDVAAFLNQQQGFQNSTEEQRQNTINSVWKRIGQIAEQNKDNEPAQPETENTPDEGNNEALSNMESDLNQSTAGKLYGKVTADEKTAINTLEDENSVYKAMNASRIQSVKDLQVASSDSLAAAIVSGSLAYDSQAMRDLMQYDPSKYQEIQTAVKQLRGQMNINDITQGNGDYISSEVDSKNKSLESEKNNLATSVATSDEEVGALLRDIDSSLASNVSATSAEGTMASITADINKLNTRLKNLKSEANSVFKGDVPQYIVNAYIANRTAEIQDKLQELQYNYDAAYTRYQTELNNSWKEKEFQLKLNQFNLDKQQQEFNQWYQKQTLLKSSIIEDDSGQRWQMNVNSNGEVYYSQVSSISTYSQSGMKGAGLKNNNPGNIKDTQFGNVIGTGANGFAQFATPEDGFDALVEKVKFNQTNPSSRYYGKTIAEYFRIYAPSSDNNNPDAYAKDVAKKLGVSINTPISQVDPIKFAAAIAKHDSGYDYSTYGQFRKGNEVSDFSMDNIEVPDSIYIVEDATKKMSRRVDPNSEEGQKLRENYLSQFAINDMDLNNISYSQGAISDDGVTPISYRQRIYNLIPATLKNSDTELKNVYEVAKTLYQNGYTADEAALTFYGLDVNKDKTGLLQKMVDVARSSGKDLPDAFYGSLGGYLEGGNVEGVITLVENSVIPDERKKEIQKYTSILSKLQNLQNAVNNGQETLGPVAGTAIGKVNKLVSNPKYQTAASAIDNAYSALRNELMGANMTETEIKAYENLFPKTTDPLKNVNIKIQQSIIGALNDINAIRKTYNLPEVNLDSALNVSARAGLYRNQDDWSDIAE